MVEKKIPRLRAFLHNAENWAAFTAVFLLALFPMLEVPARKIFKTGVPGSTFYIRQLVLVITFIGSMITARQGEHLSLSYAGRFKEPFNRRVVFFNGIIASMIAFAFALASLSFALRGFDTDRNVGFIPVWTIALVMCLGFAVMGVRFVPAADSPVKRLTAWIGLPAALFIAIGPIVNIFETLSGNMPGGLEKLLDSYNGLMSAAVLPLLALLLLSAVLGGRIFIVLGGIGYLLFVKDALPVEVVPDVAYTMLTSDVIPAIPLFTVTGFVLSESKAGERLVRLFKSLFGWIPGGLAVVTILVSAFFTTFTGASGVTIVALGGLLLYVLTQGKYKRDFNIGLLTASGSIGLLFPPSLPIIIYGVIAGVNIKHLFIGGILPGVVMVLVLVIYGVIYAGKNKILREPFQWKEMIRAIRAGIWEILLPIAVILGYLGGLTTLVESAAFALVYAVLAEVFIKRDLRLKQLPQVILKSIPIIGGVLIIMAVSQGLQSYMVDAQVPTKLAAWLEVNIASKYLFLLLLNIALLITGCFMDIFSAILVVVPLIIPLGKSFGIDPVHLGIIFLANLELGYLTPPVGLNLFLAAYRFKRPMVEIYRDVMPFFFIQLGGVLVITYLPFLSLALL